MRGNHFHGIKNLNWYARMLQDEQSLGYANLSHFTSGPDGIKVIDAWPNVDRACWNFVEFHTY